MRTTPIALAAMLALAALTTACATYSERQDAVVAKARSYALCRFPELSENQRHHVSFAKPRLLQRRILIRGGGAEFESDRDLMQTWVVWELPESDGRELVVVGVGERKFAEWNPVRVIIRPHGQAEEEYGEEP